MAKKKTINVKTGGYSSGKTTCRLGVHIPVEKMSLEEAHDLLCGSRCEVTLTPKDGDQPDLPGMEKTKKGKAAKAITSVVDIKGFGVKPEGYGFGLTFAADEVNVDEVQALRQQELKLSIKRVGDAEAGTDPTDAQQETIGGEEDGE